MQFSTATILALLSATTISALDVSPNGMCGPASGYTCLGSANGDSCSRNNQCGRDAGYQSLELGCQPDYGLCGSPSQQYSSSLSTASAAAASSASAAASSALASAGSVTSSASSAISSASSAASSASASASSSASKASSSISSATSRASSSASAATATSSSAAVAMKEVNTFGVMVGVMAVLARLL